MKSKKVISLLLTTALTAGLLAGCGGSGDSGSGSSGADSKSAEESSAEEASGEAPEGSSEEVESGGDEGGSAEGEAKYPRDENGYPDLGGETISIWFAMTTENSGAVSTDMGDYEAIKALEEKFNVNFEFIHPPVGQESENFNIMMSDEKLPDMIFCRGIDRFYPGGVEMAYADGVLYDYTDDINAVDTPNFYNMISSDPFLMKAVTDDEGRIIRLGAKICGSEEADLNFIGPIIRSDYLAAANMEVPQTIDDWTAMLQAMKDNGVEYPLALDKDQLIYTSNIFAGAYGVSGNSYFVKEDGTVGFGPYEDAYKDFLTQMHEWYEAGFINPDFASQDTDSIMSMAAGDRIGSTLIHLYTYGVTYFVTTEGENPDKVMVAAPMPVLKKILCAIDLSEQSESVAEYAVMLARLADASIVAVYAAPTLTQYTGFHVPPNTIDNFVGEIVSGAEKSMSEFVAQHFAGVDARGVVVVGYAAEEILAVAEKEQVDLIVMGTRGRKGIDLILFGSVAEKVVKNAACPVVTIRPTDGEEE